MVADGWSTKAAEALAVHPGFRLADLDTHGTPGFSDGKKTGAAITRAIGERMSDLQERLFAEGRTGGTRSILLVLQGLDTAGKGGIVRHVMGMVDPQGVALHSFGVPTAEERKHDYLWRIRRALPPAGRIGVFDRSHYEDVLVTRVNDLVPRDELDKRYDEIVDFEAELARAGTRVIKVALMISHREQYRRLHERLERSDKHWKFNPSDVDTRERWEDYQEAYQLVLDRTSTPDCPWHVVPADRKWFARLAVSQLVLDALEDLDLHWPAADYDVAEQLARLEATR